MKQAGASKEDIKQIMAAHEKDMQNLIGKIEADKLRMQSNLQHRLKKSREERMRAKQTQLADISAGKKQDLLEKQKRDMDRLNADEVKFNQYNFCGSS